MLKIQTEGEVAELTPSGWKCENKVAQNELNDLFPFGESYTDQYQPNPYAATLYAMRSMGWEFDIIELKIEQPVPGRIY